MSAAIQFQQVTHRYRGVLALRELDLEVPRGCLYGLIGKSGAGKTTTLRVLLGLLRPSRGRIDVLGTRSNRVARLAGRVGVTFDRPALFDHLSVRDNLRLFAQAHGRSVDPHPLLESLELAHLAPRRAARLSAGQRQRLALARALVLDPELLILDEPLVHLDPHSAATALEVLRTRVTTGVTVFLSSHQLAHLERFADRLALLDQGRLVLEGDTDELLRGRDQWLRVRAHPRDRAVTILRNHPLVAEVSDTDGEVRVHLPDGRPEVVNAALHEAGVNVSLLAPDTTTLDDLFLKAVNGEHGDP